MSEVACTFGETARLDGIYHRPAADPSSGLPVVIMLNAGLIHRVGPHRLYVETARALAAQGHPVLRFDHSNVGESEPRRDKLPFEQGAVTEVKEAMDYVQATWGHDRFILMGVCSGAMIACRTSGSDSRVAGAILINTQSHLAGSGVGEWVADRTSSRYMWHVSLFNPKSWKSVLTGKSDYRAILRLVMSQLTAPFRRRRIAAAGGEALADLAGLVERDVELFLLYSRGDPAYELLRAVVGPRLKSWRKRERFRLDVVSQTDHTFTPRWCQQLFIDSISGWARSRFSSDTTAVDEGIIRVTS